MVFTVNDNGWGEIWLMDASGENREQLTDVRPEGSQASGDSSPTWSPDRKRIAFTGTGDSVLVDPTAQEIYAMDPDGTHVDQLTKNTMPDLNPDWSPDGKQIAFSRGSGLGTEFPSAAVYVMDADGSDQKQVYRAKGKGVLLVTPDWSPDGKQIAFTQISYPSGSPQAAIYVMSSDGTGAKLIARNAAEPAWSPDGKLIAYSTSRDRNGQTCFEQCTPSDEIYVANADGTSPRRLTNEKGEDASPAWSPDGKQIAYVSDNSNRGNSANEIYVVDATGGTPRRITQNDVWDLEPDWR
jgi:TolB protein